MKHILVVLLSMNFLLAQGVTVGSLNPPDQSAGLHLDFQDKGFLMRRLTTPQRNSIISPAVGLQIFNLTTECVAVYFSSGWQPAACECQQAPAAPGSIQGSSTFCPLQTGVVFRIPAVQGAVSYQWTVPPGAQITSGSGTDSIVVSMGTTGGNVSVSAINSCGTSVPASLAVTPQTPNPAFGPISGSPGSPVTFTTQPGATQYQWTFSGGTPANSSISSPQVTWNSVGSYAVKLVVSDANGCSDSLTQNISIVSCQAFTQTFTPCGATGQSGPSQAQCNSTYGNGVVTVMGSGIQQWNVPQTGTYRITVAGGTGGSATSGGAIIRADVSLTAGSTLSLLVGQAGISSGGGARVGSCGSGGGGGYSGGNVDDTCSPGSNAGAGGGGSYIIPGATNVSTSNGAYNLSNQWNGQAIGNIGSQNNGTGYITVELICS